MQDTELGTLVQTARLELRRSERQTRKAMQALAKLNEELARCGLATLSDPQEHPGGASATLRPAPSPSTQRTPRRAAK